FRVADLNVATFEPGACDCVVAHDALHHVLDLDHALAASEQAMAPGGTLIVSDFIGASRVEKLLSAALYSVLPTRQPYRGKWNLRHRLRAFLASERQKRAALERGDAGGLHQASPFEGISQGSIPDAVAARFDVVERF